MNIDTDHEFSLHKLTTEEPDQNWNVSSGDIDELVYFLILYDLVETDPEVVEILRSVPIGNGVEGIWSCPDLGENTLDVVTYKITQGWKLKGSARQKLHETFFGVDVDRMNQPIFDRVAQPLYPYLKSKISSIEELDSTPTQNRPPEFKADPLKKNDAKVGTTYQENLRANVTDPDGDEPIFSKVKGPSWLSVSSEGKLGGRPKASDVGANRFTISVSDGSKESRGVVLITVIDPRDPDYCETRSDTAAEEWIAQVSIGPLEQSSSGSESGYQAYDKKDISLPMGEELSVALVPEYLGNEYEEYFKIWVDLNQDGDFQDEGENVFDSKGASVGEATGSLVVPVGSRSGQTRMRVSMRYSTAPPICGRFSYGEVEDYTITLQRKPSAQ